MSTAMSDRRDYRRTEEIEIRAARGAVDMWVPAKIKEVTKNGAHITRMDSTGHHRETHICWRDMRKKTPKPESSLAPESGRSIAQKTWNPVLSEEQREKLAVKSTVESQTFEAPVPPPMSNLRPIRPTEENASNTQVEEQSAARAAGVEKPVRWTFVGSLLRAARTRKDAPMEEVSAKVGFGRSQIYRYENGEQRPTDDVIQAYVEHFECNLDLLLLARDNPQAAIAMLLTAAETGPAAAEASIPMPPVMLPPAPAAKAQEAPDMAEFFDFCDQMEAICPQPRESALRKQWREYAQGLFKLRSKI